MNLFIYTGASRLNAAVVESATDLTPVSRLPDLIVGDSEPVTVKFLSASGAYESWSGGGTYTLSISIGALGGDGIAAYFQTSSFTTVTNGWTGRLNLASGSLPSVVAGYLAERPGAQSVPLFVQVRVTDASGYTETYARQAVSISGAVSVPTTANSTPVTYATAADVAANASTASAAAIAAAASASAAAGSASTAAGHVTTAGNSATAAAASAVTAGNSATTASGHATTAITQATNAATSASSASTYKDAAAVSAASATSSAGTATTQAALATTNGAAQVALATTQATNAAASATAAGVSAAAALVSEAAALVSKNAAAASAATASAVSGSGNGTFSAAALTGVNSITASASTPLTLTGGSTGASLVLGQGASGPVTVSPKGSASMQVSNGSSIGSVLLGGGSGSAELYGDGSSMILSAFGARAIQFYQNSVEKARFAATTGNLLIGTTTDMTGVAGGVKIAATNASLNSTSGALQVAGGIYAGAASVFGGTVTASSTIIANAGTGVNTIAGSNTSATGFGAYFRGGSVQGSGKYLLQLVNYDASKNYLFYDDIATFPGAATFAGDVTISKALPKFVASTTGTTGYGAYVDLNGSSLTGGTTWQLASVGSTEGTGVGNFNIAQSGVGAFFTLTKATGAATFAGAVTMGGNLTLPAAAAATTRYILSAANNDGTIVFQNGVGSAASGGSLQLSGSTHATRPGWVTVGLGSGSTRKFTVSDSGTPGGTDVFTVDATGHSVFSGVVIKKNYTVATLPAAASYTYGEAYVSDATQAAGTSLGSAPTGGGSVKRGVYSDGSSWLLR